MGSCGPLVQGLGGWFELSGWARNHTSDLFTPNVVKEDGSCDDSKSLEEHIIQSDIQVGMSLMRQDDLLELFCRTDK